VIPETRHLPQHSHLAPPSPAVARRPWLVPLNESSSENFRTSSDQPRQDWISHIFPSSKIAPLLDRHDNGWLSRNRTASQIENHIRSADYSPFPSPWAFPVTQNDPLTVGFVKAETTDRPAEAKLRTVGERTSGGIFVAALDYMVHVMLLQVEGQRRKARANQEVTN